MLFRYPLNLVVGFEFSRVIRIEKAKELLRDNNYTLKLIAIMTGFSRGNNFQAALNAFLYLFLENHLVEG